MSHRHLPCRKHGDDREPAAPACKLETILIIETELDFLREREAQERSAADKAKDPAAREVHLTLAKRYARRTIGTLLAPPPTDGDPRNWGTRLGTVARGWMPKKRPR